ncbi:hypothetical protein CGGC5_v007763 [Colletotrichum fructicola Nara gc5]|uniref:Uncharacterized protein n=1 Tax=Colletotrichum fructicola (strain Nara gc5) TaxID=1213859 RepID=A0A7J6J7C3_COLFN|nr:hypothetical protein CGGC5_v007763 [Colletotrichum fructicola Nara gc5]
MLMAAESFVRSAELKRSYRARTVSPTELTGPTSAKQTEYGKQLLGFMPVAASEFRRPVSNAPQICL